jgi:hypothetical protein
MVSSPRVHCMAAVLHGELVRCMAVAGVLHGSPRVRCVAAALHGEPAPGALTDPVSTQRPAGSHEPLHVEATSSAHHVKH